MPKTVEDLRQSRENSAELLKPFNGKVPTSILRADFSDEAIDLSRTANQCSARPDSMAFKMSGVSVRDSGGAFSRFPQNVGRQLLLFYTKEGDTVLDPFAGHNSRMQFWVVGYFD